MDDDDDDDQVGFSRGFGEHVPFNLVVSYIFLSISRLSSAHSFHHTFTAYDDGDDTGAIAPELGAAGLIFSEKTDCELLCFDTSFEYLLLCQSLLHHCSDYNDCFSCYDLEYNDLPIDDSDPEQYPTRRRHRQSLRRHPRRRLRRHSQRSR
jgi:hypothetical protein